MRIVRWLAVTAVLVGCGTTPQSLGPAPSTIKFTSSPAPIASPSRDPAVPPIALVSDIDGAARVYLSTTNGERRPLTPKSNLHVNEFSPAWSPDGRWLAQHRINASGVDELWVHDPTNDAQWMIAEVGPPSSTDPRVSWSPDGSRIAYWSTSGTDNEIMVVDADGAAPPFNLTGHTSADRYPTWSPDGDLIAFWSDRSGRGAVWLTEVDGEDPRELVEVGVMLGPPAWSPDASRLAVPVEQPGDRWLIRIVDRSGTTQSELTGEGSVVGASWSPNGQSIAYWHLTGPLRQLFLATADGADPRPIGPPPATAEHRLVSHPGTRWPPLPSWSPDSEQLAAEWPAAGQTEVLVIQRQDGGWSSITPPGVNDGTPDWRP